MGKEIKIDYNAVEEALKELDASGTSLKNKEVEFEGKNSLTVVEEIKNINKILNDIAEEYKNLLRSNISATREAVKAMKETDEGIAQKVRKEQG